MNHKPIAISPELAAKYEHEGQKEQFDAVLGAVLAMPKDPDKPPVEHIPRPRGRPKKIKADCEI